MKNKLLEWRSYLYARVSLKLKPKVNISYNMSISVFDYVDADNWGSAMGGNGKTEVATKPTVLYPDRIKLSTGRLPYTIKGCDWHGNRVPRNHYSTIAYTRLATDRFSCEIKLDNKFTWKSFWLLGVDEDGYKEVDLFETFTHSKSNGMLKLTATQHSGTDSETDRKQKVNHYWIPANGIFPNDDVKVTFEVELGKKIKLYTNGYKVYEIKNPFKNSPKLIFSNGTTMDRPYMNGRMEVTNIKH